MHFLRRKARAVVLLLSAALLVSSIGVQGASAEELDAEGGQPEPAAVGAVRAASLMSGQLKTDAVEGLKIGSGLQVLDLTQDEVASAVASIPSTIEGTTVAGRKVVATADQAVVIDHTAVTAGRLVMRTSLVPSPRTAEGVTAVGALRTSVESVPDGVVGTVTGSDGTVLFAGTLAAPATCEAYCQLLSAAAGLTTGVGCGVMIAIAGVGSAALPVIGTIGGTILGAIVCGLLSISTGVSTYGVCQNELEQCGDIRTIVTIDTFYCDQVNSCSVTGQVVSRNYQNGVGTHIYFYKSRTNYSFCTPTLPLRFVNNVGGHKYYEFAARLSCGPYDFVKCTDTAEILAFTDNYSNVDRDASPKPRDMFACPAI